MSNGSFGDFLNSLRAFDSGVSIERIAQNRTEVIQQVGQDRFDAFENGELTLTDLQYSSQNSSGYVGYQLDESVLVNLGYYISDSTPGLNDFSGTFTGKNGVDNLNDLMTNVQEQIILDEFRLNLERIETGLSDSEQSLDDFIGHTVEIEDADGGQATIDLSLSGILATAHLRGVPDTLDLLLNDVASEDGIGASDALILQQFGGFDVPSVADLRSNTVEPLETDATLTIETPFESGPSASDLNGGSALAQDQANGDMAVAEVADASLTQPEPAAPSPSAGLAEGTNLPDELSNDLAVDQNESVEKDTGDVTVVVTETEERTTSADAEFNDDLRSDIARDDASVAVAMNDLLGLSDGNDERGVPVSDEALPGGYGDNVQDQVQDLGAAPDPSIPSTDNNFIHEDSNDVLHEEARDADADAAADRFVFSSSDGSDIIRDFQVGLDRIDVSTFDDGLTVELSKEGENTVIRVGDVMITLENVEADDLSDADFIGASFDEDPDGDEPEFTSLTSDPVLIG